MVAQKIDQCMKPHGEEGVETIERMNENHRDISEFAFECIEFERNAKILDIGCGGGVNIEKFLNLTDNNVDGLDYSEVSVAESIRRNGSSGRCEVFQANVCDMPIEDESYDLVTAFETVYFWPEIGKTFKEVSRIIKSNGQFMIAQGTDGNHPDDEKWLNTVEGMSLYTASELERCLLDAGFSTVQSYVKENDHILIVIAQK